MFLLDANVIIYAFRRDAPVHAPCYAWLTGALSRVEDVVAPSVMGLALLHITTLPSLGEAAAQPEDVFAFLEALRQTSYQWLEPGEAHAAHLRQLCAELDLKGNDINNAFLAVLAIERGAVLVSADKGFARFQGIRWLNPNEIAPYGSSG